MLAFTDDQAVRRRLNLRWGVMPFWMPFCTDPEVGPAGFRGSVLTGSDVRGSLGPQALDCRRACATRANARMCCALQNT